MLLRRQTRPQFAKYKENVACWCPAIGAFWTPESKGKSRRSSWRRGHQKHFLKHKLVHCGDEDKKDSGSKTGGETRGATQSPQEVPPHIAVPASHRPPSSLPWRVNGPLLSCAPNGGASGKQKGMSVGGGDPLGHLPVTLDMAAPQHALGCPRFSSGCPQTPPATLGDPAPCSGLSSPSVP